MQDIEYKNIYFTIGIYKTGDCDKKTGFVKLKYKIIWNNGNYVFKRYKKYKEPEFEDYFFEKIKDEEDVRDFVHEVYRFIIYLFS